MAVDQDGSVEKRMNMSLDDIIKETSKVKKGSGPRGKGINVAGKRGKVSGGKKRRCRSVLRLRVQVRQVPTYGFCSGRTCWQTRSQV